MKNKKENIYRIHYKYRYATLTFEKNLTVKPFLGLTIVDFNSAHNKKQKIVTLNEETTSIFYNTWNKIFEIEAQIKLEDTKYPENYAEYLITLHKNFGWRCTTVETDIAVFKELIRHTQEKKICAENGSEYYESGNECSAFPFIPQY